MMKTSILYCILAAALLSIGCMASLPENAPEGGITYRLETDIRLRGFRRTALIHVPKDYRSNNPLPMVVAVHGEGLTGKDFEKQTGFSRLADKEGFIVVYPEGMGIFGFMQHWNAGHCCGKAAADQVDDVGFLETIIKETTARLSVDKNRIYMTGFSNGGMLTYRFAAEKGHLLAGAAVLSASIGGRSSRDVPVWRIPKPGAPVPMIIFHGTADDIVPYQGGTNWRSGNKRACLPVSESVNFWVRNNGCNPWAIRVLLQGNAVVEEVWKGCGNGGKSAEVRAYMLKDWGHQWAGSYFTDKLPAGHPLKGFDAAEMIWAFFKQYQR